MFMENGHRFVRYFTNPLKIHRTSPRQKQKVKIVLGWVVLFNIQDGELWGGARPSSRGLCCCRESPEAKWRSEESHWHPHWQCRGRCCNSKGLFCCPSQRDPWWGKINFPEYSTMLWLLKKGFSQLVTDIIYYMSTMKWTGRRERLQSKGSGWFLILSFLVTTLIAS